MTRSSESGFTLSADLGPAPLAGAVRRLDLASNLPDGREAFQRMPGGSVPLFTDGSWVLKFFPPGGERFAHAEWTALQRLHGRVDFEVPEPRERFELEGWSVVGMSLVGGFPARAVWSHLDQARRLDLSHQLGRAMQSLHGLCPPRDPVLQAPGGNFESYLRQRRERFARSPESVGRNVRWIERAGAALESYIDSRPEFGTEQSALLHTEIMPEHVMIRCEDHRPRLVGLVDFEPSMVGDPLYEFASIGWFWAEGDPKMLKAVLAGYNEGRARPLSIRGDDLMAQTLAHRYFHRERWLARLNPACRKQSLAELTRYVFGQTGRISEAV